jgi:hypothetical protein
VLPERDARPQIAQRRVEGGIEQHWRQEGCQHERWLQIK